MRYKIFARIVRAFLMLGIILIVFTAFLQVGSNLFGYKSYIKVGNEGITIGDFEKGYLLPMRLSLSIPDTITTYRGKGNSTATFSVFNDLDRASNFKKPHDSLIERRVINKLKAWDDQSPVKISNRIVLNGDVMIKANSQEKSHTFFWGLYHFIQLSFYVIVCILLIKLINSYLKNSFLNVRSFNLISWLGMLFIVHEILNLGFICFFSKIIPAVTLDTAALIGQYYPNGISMSLNFGSPIDFSKIIIGIIIIILSKIIKDAVLIKQENDLTI